MHPDVFAEYGEHIFRLAPIRHVDFVHPYDEDQKQLLDDEGNRTEFPLDRVLACPALDRLETLGFVNLTFPPNWAQQMVECLYLSMHMTFHSQDDIVSLLESPQIRKLIQIVGTHVGRPFSGHTQLGIGTQRSSSQGGPETSTFYYGELGKKLEEKYGYVPWLHESPNERHDLWWKVETGRLPKFPVGSLPPKDEWYVPPEPVHHPRMGW
jgi:hypothetical protein